MTYVVLLPDLLPLGGRCPCCRAVIDDSGCRIGRSVTTPADVRERTGIARALEVHCLGEPVLPIADCPSCGEPA